MSIATHRPPDSLHTRVLEHMSISLYRNGYALVLSSLLTSGLGVAYWILAARYYPPEIVGVNAALISTMIFLAKLAELNLTKTLNRFVPTAGQATARFVVVAYIISASLALVVGFVFVLGVRIWAPTMKNLTSSPQAALWFICATLAWCVFVQQDSTLTGLRQAHWVPLENVLFAVTKIVLLIAFADLFTRFGLFVSWTIPAGLLLLPVNRLIFKRLIPQHVRSTTAAAVLFIPQQIVRYAASDYFASLTWTAAVSLLPLLVLERAGASANAYFYLAWTIAYSLTLVSQYMGMALIAEAARDPKELGRYSYRMLVQTLRLLLPAVAILVVAAPYVLLLFGADYASEATRLLRLLVLAALPNAFIAIFISIARVRRRMKAIMVVLTAMAAATLTVSYLLLANYGITGIGIAWLAIQTVVAAVLLVTQLFPLWRHELKFGLPSQLRSTVQRLRLNLVRCGHLAAIRKITPEILARIPLLAGLSLPTSWKVLANIHTNSDVAVFRLGPTRQSPVAILKLARSSAANRSLHRRGTALAELHSMAALREWRALLPSLIRVRLKAIVT